MARTTKQFRADVPEEALATALHRILEVSHRQAKGLIDASCVKVNGETARTHGQRLKEGDAVEVVYDAATAYKELPRPKKGAHGAYEVLWEDKHLIFVNKPAGLLTVPAEKGGEANLADAITDNFRRRGFKRFQLFIAHRLDRFTSGVLVFAKTPEALHGLKKYFENHDLQRVYKAVLVGELPENSGTLTDKLVEHTKSLRMTVDKSGKQKGAKHAVTHYRVLERLPGHTVVEVKLETGRRNQIRVQFADKGYPLLGDQVYGEESELIDRQALHAEVLGFRHPVTEDQITVTAPLPADLEAALKSLRTRARVQRAEAGTKGEEGIFKPKITLERKLDRVYRAERFSEKPEGEDRPRRADRPEGDRPRGPRPRREGEEARPRTSRGEAGRPEGRPAGRKAGPEDRPGRRPFGGRPEGRPEQEDRKARTPGRGPARPQGGKPAGPQGGKPTGRQAGKPTGKPAGKFGAKPGVKKPGFGGPGKRGGK